MAPKKKFMVGIIFSEKSLTIKTQRISAQGFSFADKSLDTNPRDMACNLKNSLFWPTIHGFAKFI